MFQILWNNPSWVSKLKGAKNLPRSAKAAQIVRHRDYPSAVLDRAYLEAAHRPLIIENQIFKENPELQTPTVY